MKMIENAEKTVIDCWGRTVGLGQAEPDQCKHRYHVLFGHQLDFIHALVGAE